MFTETLNFLSVLFPSSLHYWPLMVKNFYSWVQLALGKKAICYISWRRGKIINKNIAKGTTDPGVDCFDHQI